VRTESAAIAEILARHETRNSSSQFIVNLGGTRTRVEKLTLSQYQ